MPIDAIETVLLITRDVEHSVITGNMLRRIHNAVRWLLKQSNVDYSNFNIKISFLLEIIITRYIGHFHLYLLSSIYIPDANSQLKKKVTLRAGLTAQAQKNDKTPKVVIRNTQGPFCTDFHKAQRSLRKRSKGTVIARESFKRDIFDERGRQWHEARKRVRL